MMTQQLEVSILTAPIAAIDRRVLSQAWYSALRLASDRRALCTAGRPTNSVRATAAPRLGASRPSFESPLVGAPQPRVLNRTSIAVRDAASVAPRAQNRAQRPSLARAIESAFSGSPAKLQRATFSMGRGSARVHVILQTQGERVMLVALCCPALLPVVTQALRHVRLSLAARGIGIKLHSLGAPTCF